MKILMIAPTPFFADRGCHTQIYEEIKALQKLGNKVVLCTYGLGRDMPEIEIVRSINFPWYRKLSAGPSYTKILLLPFLTWTVIKTIKQFQPEIIHAHLHEGAIIARICKIFFKKPKYLFDMQGSLVGETVQHGFISPNGPAYFFLKIFEKKIINWFPIITQSANMVKDLENSGVPIEKIANVQDGVDTEIFSPREADRQLAQEIGVSLHVPRVLYLGLLETYQGSDLLFEAFRFVTEKKPEAFFIVIGYPNIEKYQAICRELGIDNKVRFLGRINYKILPRYLSLAEISVAPKIALTEGDGKIYNYMAMGLPTVAFDRETSREILGDTGTYAKFGDSQDLADKIIFLLDNKEEAKKLGDKARERAVANLSWLAVGKRINSFYKTKI